MSFKKIAFFSSIIVSLFIINGLVHSIISLWQKKHLIDEARQELIAQKQENKKLKQQLSQVNKQQFIEEQARDKLFLVKPGEGIVVMPTQAVHASSSGKTQPIDSRPNWLKWWQLFF